MLERELEESFENSYPEYIETNIKFSQLQMHLVIEAIKNYPWDYKSVKKIEIEDGQLVCNSCNYPYEVDIYIKIKEKLAKKFPSTDDLGDKIELYWKRKYNKETAEISWYLGKYAPCGKHFAKVFEGKKTFNTCNCPDEYKNNICIKIKKIIDNVLSLNMNELVTNSILIDIN